MASEFGKWMKNKLYEAGMTQKDFAKMIDITEAAVSYYASGKRIPSGKTMRKIEDLLGEHPKADGKTHNETHEIERGIRLWQLLYYMTEEDVIQICFEGDGWENFTELNGNSKLLKPLMNRRIVCMGAEEGKHGHAIRVSIKEE